MIIASMCTIPNRKDSFKAVVKRILHEQTRQVDRLYVSLNGYKEIDSDLPKDERLEYRVRPENPGPQARYFIGKIIPEDSIVFTLDDDLFYPTDFIEIGEKELNKHDPKTSISFGGVFWDWIVPKKYLEYHAHKRLIPCTGKLETDTAVPVLLGGASFHRGFIFRKLLSHELKGFSTNDDLMASYNIQKTGNRIVSIAKPSYWIKERPEQNSSHSLWCRDVSTRIKTFKYLVRDYNFIPWCVDTSIFQKTSSFMVISSGEIYDQLLENLKKICPNGNTLHTLEIVEGNLYEFLSRPLRSHQEHFLSIPIPKGRFDFIFPVHQARAYKVERQGCKILKNYLGWAEKKLNLQAVVFFHISGPKWIQDNITAFSKGKEWSKKLKVISINPNSFSSQYN